MSFIISTHQVVEQGLTPDMAMRACNNLEITSDKLSRALRDPILERAKTEAEMIREREEEKKDDDLEEGVASSKTPSSSKRRRVSAPARISATSATSASSSTTPTPSAAGRMRSASISISSLHNFSAPYLKNKTTHSRKR